jgi:acetyl esterase/lipase
MLEDCNTGISWVLRKIDAYGGDPSQVHLVGQSAGGQLALLALLNQAMQVRWQVWVGGWQGKGEEGARRQVM